MARLIDKDTLIHDLCAGLCGSFDQCKKWCSTLTVINMQPTIDAQPVRHGQWNYDLPNAYFRCSECLMMYRDNPNYCPRCGAKMDGGAGNG